MEQFVLTTEQKEALSKLQYAAISFSIVCGNLSKEFLQAKEKIQELNNKINKMKCCSNCKNNSIYNLPFWECCKSNYEKQECHHNDYKHWEIK